MTHRHAQAHFLETIAARLSETVLGQDIDYDMAPSILPGPEAFVAYVLILSCRSPVLAPPRIAVTDLILDANPGDHALTESVDRAVGQLMQVRRQLLGAAN